MAKIKASWGGAKKQRSQKTRVDYKATLLNQIQLAGLPAPTTEHAFAAPERRWRFDFAYLDARVAIEYQGGVFHRGGPLGHNTTGGITKDFEKFTEASLRGWTLILVDAGSVRNGKAVNWIVRAMQQSSA